jgi:tetratricopeptide (TPR) repeat protein
MVGVILWRDKLLNERIPMKYAISVVIAAVFGMATFNASAHEYSKLIRSYKYAEVEKAVNAKLAADPKNLDALLGKIEVMLNQGQGQGQEQRLNEALKLAEVCVAAHPHASECHELMGNIEGIKIINGGMFAAMSGASKVRDSFLKAVELDPKNYSARMSLLSFYLQAPGIAGGGKDKAMAFVADTAKVSKDAAALLQARLDIRDDKLTQAESTALAVNTAGNEGLEDLQLNALSSIGIQYREQKKFSDSERVLLDVIKRFPNHINGPALLGRTLAAQARHAEAITQFEKALTLEDRAVLHYRIAQSQLALGEKVKAIQGFEKALALKNGLDKKLKEDAQQQLKTLKA